MSLSLPEQVKELMIENKLTLAVAESLTCGNLQALIGSVSGASNYFQGGITAYNIGQKVNLLGVEYDHAKKVNCVSKKVVQEMAEGVCELTRSSVGIATTGYAEGYNGVEQMAYICVAFLDPDTSTEDKNSYIFYHGTVTTEVKALTRVEMQKRVSEECLTLLLKGYKKYKESQYDLNSLF
jgi:PncC family amidohydrolase